ncbi:MAG: GntR family transcriptional regulator [Hyphomicrobiales bacterium]|nr:MAG: GntR family transcriptional regulator [Hyphomicrobiales bacterium]
MTAGIDTPESGKKQHQIALMRLREMVLDGTLPAGGRLSEISLAERIGISRTPIREALSRLEGEGLLERASGGGYLVRTFTFEDVHDAIELRGVLEGTSARLAAERGVEPSQLREIKLVVDALDPITSRAVADGDVSQYQELNFEFHQLLSSLSGSEIIRRELERAKLLPFASPNAFLGDRTFRRSMASAQAQHRAIVEAIEMREGARAEALAREHARMARKNLDYVMHQDRSLIPKIPGLTLVSQ